VRQASPAALRLSVWAYAHLLRAYPASFRAEFGGEMALLFSDCCRDEWRSAGPAGVCRLLTRVVLDTLVSAPPLWAERLEETMKGPSADRRWGFWLADHALAMGGLALLAVGAATSWWAMSLGWAALAIAFFAWVGLGSDGLSSSSYGPEEAFLQLGAHQHRHGAGRASAAEALWIYAQMLRWGQLAPGTARSERAARVFRPELAEHVNGPELSAGLSEDVLAAARNVDAYVSRCAVRTPFIAPVATP